MLIFKPGNYYRAIWFLSSEQKPIDIMGAMFREGPCGDWVLKWRMRYSMSPDPFDERDEKIWRHAVCHKGIDREDAYREADKMFVSLAKQFELDVDRIEPNTDEPAKIFEHFKGRKWAHTKQVSKDPTNSDFGGEISKPDPKTLN
jgi:hypothetical protein